MKLLWQLLSKKEAKQRYELGLLENLRDVDLTVSDSYIAVLGRTYLNVFGGRTVNIQVDGSNAASQSGFVCDGTNYFCQGMTVNVGGITVNA